MGHGIFLQLHDKSYEWLHGGTTEEGNRSYLLPRGAAAGSKRHKYGPNAQSFHGWNCVIVVAYNRIGVIQYKTVQNGALYILWYNKQFLRPAKHNYVQLPGPWAPSLWPQQVCITARKITLIFPPTKMTAAPKTISTRAFSSIKTIHFDNISIRLYLAHSYLRHVTIHLDNASHWRHMGAMVTLITCNWTACSAV